MVSQRLYSNKQKNLFEKCKKDVSDPLLGILKLRNVAGDQVLGSPAVQFMLRQMEFNSPLSFES